MLTDRRQTARRESERELRQRGKLIPLFGRIAENPFDRARLIIETNQEVLTAGDDYRVIRPIIGGAVIVKPICRCRKNKLAWIIASCNHCRTNDIGHIKSLEHC